MRYLKMLGLAAVAAAALTAFLGAGSASAHVLCTEGVNAEGLCLTPGGDYASGTVFTAEASNPVLTVSGSSLGVTAVTCKKSNVSVKTLSTGKADSTTQVEGEVTDLTFSECSMDTTGFGNGSSCTVSTGSGYKGSISTTALTVNSTTSTTVTCLGFITCTYSSAKGIQLGLTQGKPASLKANGISLSISSGGSGCGTTTNWDATYTLNGANTGLWVGKGVA